MLPVGTTLQALFPSYENASSAADRRFVLAGMSGEICLVMLDLPALHA